MRMKGGELQVTGTSTSLARTEGRQTAVELRRQMLEVPEVTRALDRVENMIFAASTRQLIGDMPTEELQQKFFAFVVTVSRDVGVRLPASPTDPNYEAFKYDVARMVKMLVQHYRQMTIADMRLAFELSMTGELDDFLPRDRNGQPDKSHYQQFNAEYLTKILNAYRRKQGQVLTKAHEALPAPKMELTPEQRQHYREERLKDARALVETYRETERLPELSSIQIGLLYDTFEGWGLAETIEVKDGDRAGAMQSLLVGLTHSVTEFDKHHIRRQGTEHPRVELHAWFRARATALRETLDRIVSEGIDIEPYIQKELTDAHD